MKHFTTLPAKNLQYFQSLIGSICTAINEHTNQPVRGKLKHVQESIASYTDAVNGIDYLVTLETSDGWNRVCNGKTLEVIETKEAYEARTA